MTRRRTSATDVGQFTAEAFSLDRFCGGRGLLRAFLNAYAVARKDSDAIGEMSFTVDNEFWLLTFQARNRRGQSQE
jgi:hypothetical protein